MTQSTIHEKFRDERSRQCAAVCDITSHSISVVYYDLALERRIGRSVCFNADISPDTVMYYLRSIISASMREFCITAADIRKLAFAAPSAITMLLEECAEPAEFFLSPDTEVLIMPIVTAEAGGGFAAALASVELCEGTAVVHLGERAVLASLADGRLRCAAYPLAGAFAGTGLESGMPCEKGAIDDVWRDSDGTLCYSVEGDTDSCGIAPSAAAAALSIMLQSGIADSDGILTDRDNFSIGEDFYISQADVRRLQSDKAMTAALLSLVSGQAQVYFSGEVFCVNGMKHLRDIGAVPQHIAARAGFCRNGSEQGMINCLTDASLFDKICALAAAAEDVSEACGEQIDNLYIKNLTF